jgi:pimeloyl-ACP methyl ester carboxylesterase
LSLIPNRRSSGWLPTRRRQPSTLSLTLAGVAGALVASAVVNKLLAMKAERDNPPLGRFLTVGGVRLHYLDRGQGPAVVLLHGNGSMVEDFVSSGLFGQATQKYRVVAFDRPGFGRSDRPRDRVWTPEAQADLLHEALTAIGVTEAVIFGHSWGTTVAAAMAVRHPSMVSGLVLASGYYFPTPRIDLALLATPAIPVIGDVMRFTVSPILARLAWPVILRRIFGPAEVPPKFSRFPREMAVRPFQLRSAAAESGLLIPDAARQQDSYSRIRASVVIIAGDGDEVISTERQSARLHHELPNSRFHRISGVGHMVHQSATEDVLLAIDEAVGMSQRQSRSGAAAG